MKKKKERKKKRGKEREGAIKCDEPAPQNHKGGKKHRREKKNRELKII